MTNLEEASILLSHFFSFFVMAFEPSHNLFEHFRPRWNGNHIVFGSTAVIKHVVKRYRAPSNFIRNGETFFFRTGTLQLNEHLDPNCKK